MTSIEEGAEKEEEEEEEVEEVPEEVWQKRLLKRQNFALHMYSHTNIVGPDPTDRGISKRKWEQLCQTWRAAVSLSIVP
jgi:hypothetical protein